MIYASNLQIFYELRENFHFLIFNAFFATLP